MQILEKCMEDMKAVYRLNEEKLDFNTKILVERAGVSEKMKTTLKARKQRYAQIVRDVKSKYNAELADFQYWNNKYSSDFKKFTREFKKLQKKFEMFETSDNNRLNEIWSMNQEEA
jgi:dynein regulatory complex protein 1